MELVVATKNKKKLQEIEYILKGLKLKITSLADYPGCPRVVENGKTFEENARKKASKIAEYTGKLTLGEDSGLEVFSLKRAPGVYSSRYAGYPKSDTRNNNKLLRALAKFSKKNERKAQYICVAALADSSRLVNIVSGICKGYIGFEPKGKFGFGYDPLFIVPKYKRTFAQLGPAMKHKISHRYRALKKTKALVEKYLAANCQR